MHTYFVGFVMSWLLHLSSLYKYVCTKTELIRESVNDSVHDVIKIAYIMSARVG